MEIDNCQWKTLAGNNPKVVEAIISSKFDEKFDDNDIPF